MYSAGASGAQSAYARGTSAQAAAQPAVEVAGAVVSSTVLAGIVVSTVLVSTVAGGVFLMALKFVIEHAILLQSENDLTI